MKKKMVTPQIKLIKLEAQNILAGSGPEYGDPGAGAHQAKGISFQFDAF